MSLHDYANSVGVTWRDKCPTRDDLKVEEIAQFIEEKRTILSNTLWGRYRHRARHHHLGFLQRAYVTWLMVCSPTV